MAVRVRIRLKPVGRSKAQAVETVALANSGFESADPEVLVPVGVAERLGLWPPPAGARAERFESPAATFSSHTYNEATARRIYANVRAALPELERTYEKLRGRIGERRRE